MSFKRVQLSGGGVSVVASMFPLSFKAVNQHVLVCGSSGSGKSYFAKKLFPFPSSVILFKPDILFQDVPLASARGLPPLFDRQHHRLFASSDVADAYLYSLGLDYSGIMASSLVPSLMSALENSFSMKEFKTRLKNMKSDKLISSVASVIFSHFSVLYPDDNVKSGRPPKLLSPPAFTNIDYSVSPVQPLKLGTPPYTISLSFAGMGSFRSEFAVELLLRRFYAGLGSDMGTLYIDEFHHVSRPGSLIDILLREFRASGRLIGITQNLSDVAPSMLSNFGHVFIGRSIHSGDISYLSLLSPVLPRLVSSLPPYTFLSLSEFLADPTQGLPLYRWFND